MPHLQFLLSRRPRTEGVLDLQYEPSETRLNPARVAMLATYKGTSAYVRLSTRSSISARKVLRCQRTIPQTSVVKDRAKLQLY